MKLNEDNQKEAHPSRPATALDGGVFGHANFKVPLVRYLSLGSKVDLRLFRWHFSLIFFVRCSLELLLDVDSGTMLSEPLFRYLTGVGKDVR